MTSLRTFQHEIDEIQHRELVKQRATVPTIPEKEKENKKLPVGLADRKPAAADNTIPVESAGAVDNSSDIDKEIQVWLSSSIDAEVKFML